MRAVLGIALAGYWLTAAAAGSVLMCQGRLAGASRPDIGQSALEFTLEYAEGMQVAQFKSDFESINGPLYLQLDEAFLRARHTQPRPLGGGSRSIGISELRVSRNTGQFSLAVALYRDLDVPDGGATWEGLCRPHELAGGKKF
jgi:hypothetical protein